MQREDFSNRRDYERELRTVSANIDMILGKNREQEQQIEKGKKFIDCYFLSAFVISKFRY